MSGMTRILGIGRPRAEETAPAKPEVAADDVRIVAPRQPSDPVQNARDLEDAAMAYSEVVRVLGAITKTTQAGETSYAGLTLDDMSQNLESAWQRWDQAQRRLIGPQRTG